MGRAILRIPPPSAVATSFSIDFTALSNENPLSQGGQFLNGQADGTHWKNFQISSGAACAAATSTTGPPPYDDAIGLLKTSVFAPAANQYVQSTIKVVGAYDPPTTHERGHFMRFDMTTNHASGYEVYWSITNSFGIIRWDDADVFTPLSLTSGTGPAARPVHGNRLRTEISGSTITVFVDTGSGFVQVATADDSTYTRRGMCGMQHYAEAGTTFGSYAFSLWECGNL